MTANLDTATKDAALVAMFRHPMFLGLAFGEGDEESDPGYERQRCEVSAPHDVDGKRMVENTQTIRFPYNLVDGERDIRIAFLADGDGVIRWSDLIERPIRLSKGEAIIFEPGDLKIGIP